MIKKKAAGPMFVSGCVLALFFIFVAAFGTFLSPQDPLKTDVLHTLAPPGEGRPLGTDDLGRCIFSRLVAGTKITLGTALIIETMIFILGTSAGLIAGYFGGIIDAFILTLIDMLLAFPSVILALVIAGLLGAGLGNLMVAMVSVYWVEHARVARSMARSLREKDFVLSSRAAGSGAFTIIRRHILPHVIPNMIIYATLDISSIIIGISSFSFIGLGVKAPAPEWGALLSEGRNYMRENPLALIAVISCIMLAAACFQFLGEAMRETLNPRGGHLVFQKGMK